MEKRDEKDLTAEQVEFIVHSVLASLQKARQLADELTEEFRPNRYDYDLRDEYLTRGHDE